MDHRSAGTSLAAVTTLFPRRWPRNKGADLYDGWGRGPLRLLDSRWPDRPVHTWHVRLAISSHIHTGAPRDGHGCHRVFYLLSVVSQHWRIQRDTRQQCCVDYPSNGRSQFLFVPRGVLRYDLHIQPCLVLAPAGNHRRGLIFDLSSAAVWEIAEAVALLVFVAFVPVAWLSYRYVEMPFLRLRARYTR
jgi:hypothetical protein